MELMLMCVFAMGMIWALCPSSTGVSVVTCFVARAGHACRDITEIAGFGRC